MQDLKSVIINLISAAIGSFFSFLYANREKPETPYSKTYINKIVGEFALSMLFVLMSFIYPRGIVGEVFDVFLNVLFFLSFVFAVFAFSCLLSVVNFFKNSNNTKTDEKGNNDIAPKNE